MLAQFAAACAVGALAAWPAQHAALLERLPPALRSRVNLVQDWQDPATGFDAVLHAGGREGLRHVAAAVAQRAGPIIGVTSMSAGARDLPLERLVVERSLSVNTAAAGGNASLMTIG